MLNGRPVTTQIRREADYYISAHAVERFRDRCEDALRPLTDRDLALQLSERIADGIKAGRVELVIDSEQPDEDTRVVKIETREVNRYLFAVLRMFRPNAYGGHSKIIVGPGAGVALGAVTVLTPDMASQNYASGRWKMKHPLQHKPFANLPAVAVAQPKPATPPKPSVEDDDDHAGLGASRAERRAYALKLLLENPEIYNRDLSVAVAKKYGRGMSEKVMADLRRQMKPLVVTPAAPAPAPTPAPAPAPTPAPAPAFDNSLAAMYMQAVEMEKTARARVESAKREHDAASEILAGASAQVDKLMDQMRAQRST